MQQSVLPDFEPCLQVAESRALVKVLEKIHQLEIHQEVGKFMASGVIGFSYVGINFSQNDRVLVPESG